MHCISVALSGIVNCLQCFCHMFHCISMDWHQIEHRLNWEEHQEDNSNASVVDEHSLLTQHELHLQMPNQHALLHFPLVLEAVSPSVRMFDHKWHHFPRKMLSLI